jgi:hypothetical protein
MSEKQSEAQQNRRARERQEQNSGAQAAKAAEAAAARVTDQSPTDFQPDPDAGKDAFIDKKPDESPREFKRGNPTRSAAYDEIMAARKEKSEAVHEEARPDAAPAPEPVAAAPEPTPEPAPAPEAEPAPELVEVNIYGQRFQVPKVDVDAAGGKTAYQQMKASEYLFQKTKESERKAAEMLAQVEQRAVPPPAPVRPLMDVVKEQMPKIQFGTPDEAAEAWAAIENAKGTVDPARIKQEAIQEFFQQSAAQAFIQRNGDVLNDHVNQTLAVLLENSMIRQQGRPRDWGQFYSSLEANLRNRLGRPTIAAPSVASPSQPTSGLADKEARKASIVALPTAATRAAAPEAEKPLTRDDILARARKARGQPV